MLGNSFPCAFLFSVSSIVCLFAAVSLAAESSSEQTEQGAPSLLLQDAISSLEADVARFTINEQVAGGIDAAYPEEEDRLVEKQILSATTSLQALDLGDSGTSMSVLEEGAVVDRDGCATLNEKSSEKLFPDTSSAEVQARARKPTADNLLCFTNRPKSLTLFNNLKELPIEQKASMLLYAQNGGIYSDLVILQPVIFGGMECIKSGTCTEEDFLREFRSYLNGPSGSLNALEYRLWKLPMLMVAELLRGLTGKKPMEQEDALKMLAFELAIDYAEGGKRMGELIYKTIGLGRHYFKTGQDYLILVPNLRDQRKALKAQMLWLESEEWIKNLVEEPYFPCELVGKRIMGRYGVCRPSVGLYIAYREHVLRNVLHLLYSSLQNSEHQPQNDFEAVDFWQAIDFLEKHPQYGGVFGRMITNTSESWEGWAELAVAGRKGFVQKVIQCQEESECRSVINQFAERFILKLMPEHAYSQEKFKNVRMQLFDGLYGIINGRSCTDGSLNQYILEQQAASRELGSLYDLQVTIVFRKVQRYCSKANPEDLRRLLEKLDSVQLRNAFNSEFHVKVAFYHVQLFEALNFDHSVREAEALVAMLQLYRNAFPNAKSAFGLLLGQIGEKLENGAFSSFPRTILKSLGEMRSNCDFLGGSGDCWLELEQCVYAKVKTEYVKDRAFSKFKRIFPELGLDEPSCKDVKLEQYKTFAELYDVLSAKRKQSEEDQELEIREVEEVREAQEFFEGSQQPCCRYI